MAPFCCKIENKCALNSRKKDTKSSVNWSKLKPLKFIQREKDPKYLQKDLIHLLMNRKSKKTQKNITISCLWVCWVWLWKSLRTKKADWSKRGGTNTPSKNRSLADVEDGFNQIFGSPGRSWGRRKNRNVKNKRKNRKFSQTKENHLEKVKGREFLKE